jgi:PAS domain S-box-containing protein
MASAKIFEHAFDALPGACALIDDDGRIIAVNAHFRTLFSDRIGPGGSLVQLYCDPLDGLTAQWKRPRTAAAEELADTALLRGGDTEPVSVRLHVRRVEPGARLVSIEPVIDAANREMQLRAARQRVAMAFEEHSAGAYSADFRTREVVVSGLLERFVGPGGADAPVRLSRWLSLFHPADLARVRAVLRGNPSGADTVVSFHCRMRVRHAGWIPMRHDVRVVERDENQNPVRITGLVHDVASDDRAEALVRIERIKTERLVSALGLSTWTYDFEAMKGTMSGPVNTTFGADADTRDIDANLLRHRIHPDDSDRIHAAFSGLQFGGQYDETFRLRAESGHWLWYRSWGAIEPAPDGERRSMKAFGFWQQIPHQQEELVEALDSDVAGVLDRAGLSSWSYDYTAREITLSGTVLHALGLSADQARMSRADFKARIHHADQARAAMAIDTMAAAGNAHAEFRVRTEGGHWIWLSLRGGVSAQSSEGTPLRASGVFAEATRRKEEERRLVDSERLLSHAVSAATLGAWEVDYQAGEFLPRGEIRALLGLDDATGWIPVSRWRDIVHPDDRALIDWSVKAIMDSAPGESRTAEYRVRDYRTDEYVWVEARGSRLGPESTKAHCAGIVLDISGRKALEASLARSEERLGRALENARQGTWRLNFITGLVEVSEFGRLIMGLPDGHNGQLDLTGWRQLIHPDDTHICEAGVAGMVEGEPLNAIYRVGNEQSGWRWVEDRGAISARDESGAPVEAIGTLVDITRRRQLELELEERDRRLDEAMDAGLSAIWSIDLQTGVQSVRGRLMEWMGKDLDADEIRAGDWQPIIHPDDRMTARKALADLMSGKSAGPIDYRLRDGDAWRWVRSKGQPVAWDESGKAIRAGGVVIDITAERQYAEALDSEREHLRQIYRTTPVMLISLDPQGKVLEVSEYWLSSMGYAREDIIGKPYHTFLTDGSKDDAQRRGGMAGLLAAGGLDHVYAQMVKADGTVIDAVSSATVELDAQGHPVAVHGISIDVTEKLAQESELKRYAAELERTNRELDRFAAVASHDLQEPLRKISAFASLIKRRHQGMLDPETDNSLEFLVDAAGRMRRLIDDLLRYSRASKRALEVSQVDMNQILAETLAELELLIGDANAQITISELPQVEGDPTLLRLLIQNLVSNALKYRKENGVSIFVSAVPLDTGWQFTVGDDGMGFDPRFSQKIFAPFQRLHGRDEYEGTGIGLAICQQAVERHGGKIWVDTAPGEGSRFHFTLPKTIPPGEARVA